MPDKTLLMLTTGGTIAGNVARDDGDPEEHIDNEALATVIEPTAARLEETWGVRVRLESQRIDDVDSSDILPSHWIALVDAIQEKYDDYDGFIVTHGTNTMGYTCAALSFALNNLNKPVVVTGSQVPFGWPGSDALMNLDNALRVATYPYDGGIRGVVCVFGSHIITGTRAKKATEFDLDAFTSFSAAGLGRIGRIIYMNDEHLKRHHAYLARGGTQPALLARDLAVSNGFDTRILSFTEFPGMLPDLFQAALEGLVERDEPLIRGVVFRAFGAGDVSTHLHPCFEYLKSKEVPVVVTTQAPNGNSNFRVNDPGKELATRELAIPAHDMSIEAITTKLAWLLARGTSYAKMPAAMHEDLHGEISVFPDRR
ncbi:asparaginase [Conexibacter woesei]|uniref:asparaginase n=1 Tax=Conexibacter woesei (strain DSM 14684 / CCUG 47730 / CIP 108061 / JCM 11494 / NBRC 100937 / ID131577) TaxID=469383 RepID=D3F547_CONWI|nr:asparaginase [Conexibacter woesei]ADB48625.1 Asparaginase/glutaminase [Conexibacter woesei DSM 14684]